MQCFGKNIYKKKSKSFLIQSTFQARKKLVRWCLRLTLCTKFIKGHIPKSFLFIFFLRSTNKDASTFILSKRLQYLDGRFIDHVKCMYRSSVSKSESIELYLPLRSNACYKKNLQVAKINISATCLRKMNQSGKRFFFKNEKIGIRCSLPINNTNKNLFVTF